MDLARVLDRAHDIFLRISSVLNEIVIALVIVFVGVIIGKIVDRLLHKIFVGADFDSYMSKLLGARRRYALATRRTIVRLIYIAAVLIALARLGLDSVTITLVFLIFLVIIGVSVVLAGIEVVPNMLAIRRLRKRGVGVDDLIEVHTPSGLIKGRIAEVTLTEVRVKRRNGDLLFIPAATLLHSSVLKKKESARSKR